MQVPNIQSQVPNTLSQVSNTLSQRPNIILKSHLLLGHIVRGEERGKGGVQDCQDRGKWPGKRKSESGLQKKKWPATRKSGLEKEKVACLKPPLTLTQVLEKVNVSWKFRRSM